MPVDMQKKIKKEIERAVDHLNYVAGLGASDESLDMAQEILLRMEPIADDCCYGFRVYRIADRGGDETKSTLEINWRAVRKNRIVIDHFGNVTHTWRDPGEHGELRDFEPGFDYDRATLAKK